MPPDGRFTVRKQRAIHRVGFAAGSGITPILSIMPPPRWKSSPNPSSPWSTATAAWTA
jgi:ferredoxin-NADP reductase